MKITAALTLALATVALAVTALAQGFNVRPGTWEFTVQIQQLAPMKGVPPAMLAQIEAQMKQPHTSRSCVTADDLKQLNLGKFDEDDDKNCKVTSSKITPTSGDIVRVCTGDDARTETAHFETASPTAMKANITSKNAEGTTAMALSGKWISADCKE